MWVEVRDTKDTWKRLLRVHLSPRKRPRRHGESESSVLPPFPPKPLSGGAAAELDFS